MFIIILCLSIVPQLDSVVIEDKFDAIEINHMYTNEGQLSFSQILFLNQGVWISQRLVQGEFNFDVPVDVLIETYVVEGYRLLKDKKEFGAQGIFKHKLERNGKSLIFVDDKGLLRKVKFFSIFETWTQEDKELIQRGKVRLDLYDKQKFKEEN